MKFTSTLLLILFSLGAQAQDVRYISDQQFVPLRSGAGSEYRIVHKGLPTGTRLVVEEEDADSDYALVSTENGTQGWIRSQYLAADLPARQQLQAATQRLQTQLNAQTALEARLRELQETNKLVSSQLETTTAGLLQTAAELAEVKSISSNALALDTNNRRLIEESELLKSRIEILSASNSRLSEENDSESFYNGVFAVLIGVIITLLIPRLWPKRRTSSSWT